MSKESSVALHFRTATAADRPRLIEMINAAFAIETFLEGTRTDEERLAAMMEKGEMFVGEDDRGRIVASVYVELRGSRGYLGMLAVDPAHQRRGLGRRMLEEGERRFREQGCEAVDIIVLSLRPDLPPAYRRLGFVEVRREPFAPSRRLKDGMECHGIVMSKAL
jgi:ribosomal protein S18 acetylase RimI-like enzyme